MIEDRDAEYRRFVSEQPCLRCWADGPCDPHHWAPRKSMGKKPPDYRCVPLCHDCHRYFHDHGRLHGWTPDDTRSAFLDWQVRLIMRWVTR